MDRSATPEKAEGPRPDAPALGEMALALSARIVAGAESGQASPTQIARLGLDLAHLLNDSETQQIMEYELEGYPTPGNGIPPEVWRLARAAGRVYERADPITGQPKQYMYPHSVAELEMQLRQTQADLEKSPDTYSPNPFQAAYIRQAADHISQRLASRKSLVYRYALRHYYRLRYESMGSEELGQLWQQVEEALLPVLPQEVPLLASAHQELGSQEQEAWRRAVQSCRRVLQALADSGPRVAGPPGGRPTPSDWGRRAGRLFTFLYGLEELSELARRSPNSQEEAQQYIGYTYLLVGDVLSRD